MKRERLKALMLDALTTRLHAQVGHLLAAIEHPEAHSPDFLPACWVAVEQADAALSSLDAMVTRIEAEVAKVKPDAMQRLRGGK